MATAIWERTQQKGVWKEQIKSKGQTASTPHQNPTDCQYSQAMDQPGGLLPYGSPSDVQGGQTHTALPLRCKKSVKIHYKHSPPAAPSRAASKTGSPSGKVSTIRGCTTLLHPARLGTMAWAQQELGLSNPTSAPALLWAFRADGDGKGETGKGPLLDLWTLSSI